MARTPVHCVLERARCSIHSTCCSLNTIVKGGKRDWSNKIRRFKEQWVGSCPLDPYLIQGLFCYFFHKHFSHNIYLIPQTSTSVSFA